VQRRLQTVCHVTPAAIVVRSVGLFCFAAVAAAVDDKRFWIRDGHFDDDW